MVLKTDFLRGEENAQDGLNDNFVQISEALNIGGGYGQQIGDVHISISPANPSERFGGTWERIANGRTLVGVDSSDTALNGSGKTGGAVNPLTTHSHSFSGRTSDAGLILRVASGGDLNFSSGNSGGIKTSNHSHSYSGTTTSQGSNNDHSNWQPFFTVYMWVRTA